MALDTVGSERTARFFGELTPRLREIREADRRRCARFFTELTPRLRAKRDLERKLDQKLAHRFNVFDYLPQDELALSRIIADLLNPAGKHGQGTMFLRTLLTGLGAFAGLNVDLAKVEVVAERPTTHGRLIDVSVDIATVGGQRWCLAFENKPYSDDQKNQVKDYLEFLKREYGERFLLVYLSSEGRGPSAWSIPRAALDQWRGRFAIQAYCEPRAESDEPEEPDEFENFRKSYSLVDWLGGCRKYCDVERLRWFLNEAERFCRSKFGGHTMTTDSEEAAIRDFVLSDADHLQTAWAVQKAWPAIRDDVCRKFLEAVHRRIEVRVREEFGDLAGNVSVDCDFDGKKHNVISLYSESWKPYDVASDAYDRTIIDMQTDKGVNGWYVGVWSPEANSEWKEADLKRRTRLADEIRKRLGGTQNNWWPSWEYVDQDKRNWELIVHKLHRECEKGGGELLDYFTETFIEVAKKAVPIINAIDG